MSMERVNVKTKDEIAEESCGSEIEDRMELATGRNVRKRELELTK